MGGPGPTRNIAVDTAERFLRKVQIARRSQTAHIHGRPPQAKRASSVYSSPVENAVIHPACLLGIGSLALMEFADRYLINGANLHVRYANQA